MMIVVSGTVPVRPDKREEAVAAALEMAHATAEEAGCVTYRFYADLEDPHLFRIFEEWETAEALAAHFQTPHMAVFNQKLPGLGSRTGRDKEVYSKRSKHVVTRPPKISLNESLPADH